MCDGTCGYLAETCGACGRWHIGPAPAPECVKRVVYRSSTPACRMWVPTLQARGDSPAGRRADLVHQVDQIRDAAIEIDGILRQSEKTIIMLCRTIAVMVNCTEQDDKVLTVYKDVAHEHKRSEVLG